MRTSWCATRDAWHSENNHHITPPPHSSPSLPRLTAAFVLSSHPSLLLSHCCRSGWRRRHARRAAPFTRRHGQVHRPPKRPQPTPSPRNHWRSYRYPPNADHRAHNRSLYAEHGIVAVSGRFAPSHAAEPRTLLGALCLVVHFTQRHTFASQSARVCFAYLSRAALV